MSRESHLAVLEELAKVFADEAEAMLRGGYESRLCGYKVRGMAERLTAAIALMRGQSDMVLVPREPTDAMYAAAAERIKANTVIIEDGPAKGTTLVRDPIAHTWAAMIGAAPKLPAPPKDSADEQ